MKTKISVEIHGKGEYNDAIIKMITNHNEGVKDIFVTPHLIEQYLTAMHAQYPTSKPVSYPTRGADNVMHIFEELKHTLSLTWKEVFELEATEETEDSDDLQDIEAFSQGALAD